jgi:hypothetical protein
VLYGHQCRTPLNWIEPGEKVIFGPDIVDEAEATVCCIQDNLKDTKSHQKSYTNKRCRPLEFEVGDQVYLKVSPMKGVKRFRVKGKLASRYIGPFPIIEKCTIVAYKLELSPLLTGVHDIFHVSQLKKCLKALVDMVLPESGTTRGRLDVSRAPDQDLGSKESCYKAQDNQVLQNSMEQSYYGRSDV